MAQKTARQMMRAVRAVMPEWTLIVRKGEVLARPTNLDAYNAREGAISDLDGSWRHLCFYSVGELAQVESLYLAD